MVAFAAFAAGASPVMVSLVTPVQAPAAASDIEGFRLSLAYGECENFTGFDIGLSNRTCGNFAGLGLGGLNIVSDAVRGVQIGLVNCNANGPAAYDERSRLVQFGIINHSSTFAGLQDGFVNTSTETFFGLQEGLLNAANDVCGVQCGNWLIFGVNIACGEVDGCQIGIVNYAGTMAHGLQIGVVNIIAEGGWAPVLPFLNGRF